MKSIEWNNIFFQDNMFDMKDKIRKSLSVKVKALRESASLTQEELAAKCNVSWRTISNLERGLVVPDLVMLVQMCEIFNTKIDDMLSLNVADGRSKSRMEREQFVVEKIRFLNDRALDFVLDELILLFKYFN